MSPNISQNDNFNWVKKQYDKILINFLNDEELAESLMNEGYKLGREAIANQVGIVSIVAIHHDCLVNFLENLKSDTHLEVTKKANLFLEEVLAPYQMLANDFSDAINLLNKRSIDFALRIRALQNSLQEKEVLLKEIYHRVKNNLQVISSLLSLQIQTTNDLLAKSMLIESVTRIKSMAIIHEMLYQSENLSKIEMGDYIAKLFNYLYEIYQINNIKYNIKVDSIYLNIDKAIPCGLIINELIANVFKHAFPKDKKGEINLTFKKLDDKLIIVVSDNGVGLPADMDIRNTASLGMQLVHNLSRQLDGDFVLEPGVHTTFTLTFPTNSN